LLSDRHVHNLIRYWFLCAASEVDVNNRTLRRATSPSSSIRPPHKFLPGNIQGRLTRHCGKLTAVPNQLFAHYNSRASTLGYVVRGCLVWQCNCTYIAPECEYHGQQMFSGRKKTFIVLFNATPFPSGLAPMVSNAHG
jgi:hypothetical protein